MDGKKKCELLKRIRKTIAEKNGIEYEPATCDQQEACSGSCPKCDAEAEYLFNELKKKGDVDFSEIIETLVKTEGHDCDNPVNIGVIPTPSEPINQEELVFDPETGDFVLASQKPNGQTITDILPDYKGFA